MGDANLKRFTAALPRGCAIMCAMNDQVRLLQISDPHLFTSREGALRGVCTYEALEQVLEHACSTEWQADAILATGDLVHDEVGGYAHLRTLLGGLGKPVYCLAGRWRVVMLDSVVPGRAHGRLGATELARLDAALGAARDRHALICLHHHPVRMASRWLDSVGLQNAEEFFAVLDRHPQVRAIAWGHVHQSYDGRRKGVRLLAVPSTCAQFLPHADLFAIDPAPPGYRQLTLNADGSIETEVIRLQAEAMHRRAAGG
jgi:Icc protein